MEGGALKSRQVGMACAPYYRMHVRVGRYALRPLYDLAKIEMLTWSTVRVYVVGW